MAKKIKLTRPELKRQRDTLARFQRYLPMLKLKQQQLQMTMRQIARELRQAQRELDQAQQAFARYEVVLADTAGVDVRGVAACQEVRTSRNNIAGVNIPIFEEAVFAPAEYSLFATPAWVDAAVADLKQINLRRARAEIIERQHELLQEELTKIIQRVNLFEKVKIPEAKEAIRRIRIQLGDEMAAAVGRAKIAKGKLTEDEAHGGGGDNEPEELTVPEALAE